MTQKTNTKWISRIFPIEHDFFGMLDKQAKITLRGVEDFAQWLDRGEDRLALGVLERQREADEARFTMEEVLVDSFSTPIDRGDLYEVSRQMDAVLDYVGDAVQEASALEILPPQPFYAKFGVSLAEGMRSLAAAVLSKSGANLPFTEWDSVLDGWKAHSMPVDCKCIYRRFDF